MQYPNPLPALIPIAIWLTTGPAYIRWLKQKSLGQFVREEGPQSHYEKAGTPTMGGLLILLSVLVPLLLAIFYLPQVGFSFNTLASVLILLVLGCLGLLDDGSKILKKQNRGVGAREKMLLQLSLGFLLGFFMMLFTPQANMVNWFEVATINLSYFYPLFTALLVAGFSNAYNLTDGLDGLAASTGIMTFMAFAFILATSFPELSFLSVLLLGACLGFLLFNRYPAKVFMGDTGSLALGGVMAAMAIVSRTEWVLLLVGAIYIIEALSVMIQVTSFKLTGKRVFKMSPIHHHFELSGWAEPQIVLAFTLFQAILAGIALFIYN